jgi:tetratricopeptide (TPR) repeat protein
LASVFLSYDRDDSNAARVIATALEKAGHSVWWDLHVRGGAQFAKVIEEALKAADAVVVLWSKHSVESAWVRDEAAAGRDSGRLIPATIDGTTAPLGFRQFQTIDLTDWKRGGKSRGYKLLADALGDAGPNAAVEPTPQPKLVAAPTQRRRWWLAAVPAAAALAAAGYFLWPSSSNAVPTVTVEAASTTPAATALSRDLLAKLGVLQASNSRALQLVEQGTSKPADLLFKVDASAERAGKATLLFLSGTNRELLWSGDFEQPSQNISDLKQQLAFSAANLLDCASDAYGPDGKSLPEDVRRLYLRGCGDFSIVSSADFDRLTRTFREITQKAPRFAKGWERLLYAEDELIFTPPFDRERPDALAQFRLDIAAARKINPDMAAAYIAEADLARSTGDFMGHVRLLDRAVERNPDDAAALSQATLALADVGRYQDAIAFARRALQSQPFSARAEQALVDALGFAGQLDAAFQELARAEAVFPGATSLEASRFRLNYRYGSAEEALKEVQAGRAPPIPGQETLLAARLHPTPANIEAAVASARRAITIDSPGTIANYMQVLAQFGRFQELFDFLLNWSDSKHVGFIGVIFRPSFHDFWRDPRSMGIAAKFGFIGYWRSTGHWPDFCSWPDLPYDCKNEAAKLGA